MKEIDVLKFRRELQTMFLNIDNYTQPDVQDVLLRAIGVIDELRVNRKNKMAIRKAEKKTAKKQAEILRCERFLQEKHDILARLSHLENWLLEEVK